MGGWGGGSQFGDEMLEYLFVWFSQQAMENKFNSSTTKYNVFLTTLVNNDLVSKVKTEYTSQSPLAQIKKTVANSESR